MEFSDTVEDQEFFGQNQDKGNIAFDLVKWPNGKIYYTIDIDMPEQLQKKIDVAIKIFNEITNHCQFAKKSNDEYYVKFKFDEKSNPSSEVGYKKKDDKDHQCITLPKNYPNGNEVKVECILHEMLHCIGFEHEHSRKDRIWYCQISKRLSNDPDFKITGISVGQYDFFSLMHYADGVGISPLSEQLSLLAGLGKSPSQIDKATIKIIYGLKFVHHGEWHEKHEMPKEMDLGLNCGCTIENNHWTCCMSTTKVSKCMIEHTGFWHEKCQCESNCKCKNCGAGCAYDLKYTQGENRQGHWSCCLKEDLSDVVCKRSFKKQIK